jgi:hypothetical protein
MTLFQFIRPAFKVPTLGWSAGDHQKWKPPIFTCFLLNLGLWLFGTGQAFIINGGIGLGPWTVLAQGISKEIGWSIGFSTFIVSLIVLLLWFPLKEKPGPGTIMNVILIAIAIDVMMPVVPIPNSFSIAMLQVAFGISCVGMGSALYLTANLGPGPRDGLMIGLQRILNRPIGIVRLGLEVCVLLIGWVLGGKIGIGTIMFAFGCGHAIAICLTIISIGQPKMVKV